jgi:ferric-dicitrate binding protein FerR (iron transport regulator)
MKNGDRLNDRHPCRPRAAEPFHEQPELVERLLILAEEEPEIPSEGAERVKQAVEPLWMQTVRSHSRRQILRWSTGLAIAASIVIALLVIYLLPNQQTIVASLEAVGGIVNIESMDGASQQATADSNGLEIFSGSWLVTGEQSRAAVRLANGQSVRLDVGSRLRLDSAQRLTLVKGGVYVDSGFEGEGGTIEIDTPLGVARDIGTQFELRVVNGSLSILVREGRVALSRAEGDLEIPEGTSVLVDSAGGVETSPIDPWAEEWDWVQVVAPTLEIEGVRLMVFLDWVSRESGRWITFADSETEALARNTVLHGTIEGLIPARALQVVLPGCGMKVEERPGAYIINGAAPSARPSE